MNIEEYRAMKAEEEAGTQTQPEGGASDVQVIEGTTEPVEQTVQETGEAGSVSNETPPETNPSPVIEQIEIDGVQVPVEELRQGYLRQSDYTKKTQELARFKQQNEIASQYFEAIQSDPEFAENIARRFGLPYMTPEEAKVQQMESELNQMRLERDIEALKSKHGDVDVQAVLQTAYEKRLPSLEDAYLLIKAQSTSTQAAPDINAIKEEIRQQVLRELQSNVDTSTVIGTGGNTTPVRSSGPELTAQELRVAQNMGMTATEYAKWKNVK